MPELEPRPNHLLVLDPRVPGWPSHLIAAGPNAAVLILDTNQDGLQQILDVAQNYAPLEGLTVLGHGSAGLLLLGQSIIEAASLSRAPLLRDIADQLSPEAQLRMSGIPGAGVAGRYLAYALSQALGRLVVTDNGPRKATLSMASNRKDGIGGDHVVARPAPRLTLLNGGA